MDDRVSTVYSSPTFVFTCDSPQLTLNYNVSEPFQYCEFHILHHRPTVYGRVGHTAPSSLRCLLHIWSLWSFIIITSLLPSKISHVYNSKNKTINVFSI